MASPRHRPGAGADGEEEAASPSAPRFRSVRTRNTLTSFSGSKLGKFALFRECSELFMEAMTHQLTEFICEPGKVICQQGEVGTCMFLLNFGEVDILVGETHVATLKDGAVFGEMAVICSNAAAAKRTATVLAKTMCICWSIDRPTLLKVFAAFPSDEKIISAQADRRLKDLQDKGCVPVPKTDRLWLMPVSPASPRRNTISGAKASITKLRSAFKLGVLTSKQNSGSQEESALPPIADNEADAAPDTEEPRSQSKPELPSGVLHTEERRSQSKPEQPSCVDDRSWTFDSDRPTTVSDCSAATEPQGERGTKKDLQSMLRPLRHNTANKYAPTPKRIALPPMKRCGRDPRRSRTEYWKIGETAEVSKARNDALLFLSKRGALTG